MEAKQDVELLMQVRESSKDLNLLGEIGSEPSVKNCQSSPAQLFQACAWSPEPIRRGFLGHCWLGAQALQTGPQIIIRDRVLLAKTALSSDLE